MRMGLIAATMVAMVIWQAQAQESSAVATPAAYLPLVIRENGTPTSTATATATRTPTATNPPAATGTPTLPPPTYNDCQADPNPAAAPNYPVRITAIDKFAETVTLQNISLTAIDLTNWHMCSITGNQQHPISGTIQPGQSTTFPGPAGSIWNNLSTDPGALYTPDGRLASYRSDP